MPMVVSVVLLVSAETQESSVTLMRILIFDMSGFHSAMDIEQLVVNFRGSSKTKVLEDYDSPWHLILKMLRMLLKLGFPKVRYFITRPIRLMTCYIE